jgi:hypothetical protein
MPRRHALWLTLGGGAAQVGVSAPIGLRDPAGNGGGPIGFVVSDFAAPSVTVGVEAVVVGACDPGRRHDFDYTMVGSGGYLGLRFRYSIRGGDGPWEMTGQIESFPASP